MKFRKKPVVIDAIRWTGNNLKKVIEFSGLHKSAYKWTWQEYEDVVKTEGLKIFTLEGKMNADVGDWIIKGVNGEFYPCKPDIFKKTYEAADESEPLSDGQELTDDDWEVLGEFFINARDVSQIYKHLKKNYTLIKKQ